MEEITANKDVSKRTVIVLLVITILVSALGAWTVLEKLDTQKNAVASSPDGAVTFNVIQPDSNSAPNAAAKGA